MLRIFADDIQSALALYNLALRAAPANGGTYFHDSFSLLQLFNQRLNYTCSVLFRPVSIVSLLTGYGQSGREGRLR